MSALTSLRESPDLARVTVAFMRKDFRYLLPATVALAMFLVLSFGESTLLRVLFNLGAWIVAVHWWMRDPVGDRTAFWLDRGLTPRRLIIAKGLGLLLTFGPLVLGAQAFVLIRLGVSGSMLGAALLESALLLLVMIAVTGAYTVVTTSALRLIVALLIGTIGVYGVASILARLEMQSAFRSVFGFQQGGDALRLLVILGWALLALVLGLLRPRGGWILPAVPLAFATIMHVVSLEPMRAIFVPPVAGPAAANAFVHVETTESEARMVITFDTENVDGVLPLGLDVRSTFADGTTVTWGAETPAPGNRRGLRDAGYPVDVRVKDPGLVARLRNEPSTLTLATTGATNFVVHRVDEIVLADEPRMEMAGHAEWGSARPNDLFVRRIFWPDRQDDLDVMGITVHFGHPIDGTPPRPLQTRGEHSAMGPTGLLAFPNLYARETLLMLTEEERRELARVLLVDARESRSTHYRASVPGFRPEAFVTRRVVVLQDVTFGGQVSR